MAKTNNAYLKQTHIISIILAIIPITNIILGILHRIEKKQLVMAILNFFFFFVFYWVDLVSVILNNDLKYLK